MIATDVDAFERMKTEILRKAEEEAKEIIRKAEEEAEGIIEAAYKEARDAEERIRREAEPKLKRVRRGILWASIVEGRKKLLNVREELISQVFKRVEREIVQMVTCRGEDYEELLIDLIREGAESIGERKIRIASNRRDIEFIKGHIEALRESLRRGLGYDVEVDLTDDPLDCIGGVVVSSLDEKLIYHNTLEGRLAKVREKLRLKVAQILFK